MDLQHMIHRSQHGPIKSIELWIGVERKLAGWKKCFCHNLTWAFCVIEVRLKELEQKNQNQQPFYCTFDDSSCGLSSLTVLPQPSCVNLGQISIDQFWLVKIAGDI